MERILRCVNEEGQRDDGELARKRLGIGLVRCGLGGARALMKLRSSWTTTVGAEVVQ